MADPAAPLPTGHAAVGCVERALDDEAASGEALLTRVDHELKRVGYEEPIAQAARALANEVGLRRSS